MATKDLLVRVLGDTRDVEAAFARSSRAANQFGASVDTTGKKADKAARNLRGFATGAAAGFGGAIAFNTGLNAIRSLIDAASESQQVLGQTKVALESTGKSWQEYGDRIEDAIAAQSRLGFDDEALFRTFSLFVRQSRDVEEAIRRNAIAMNLARARFIDLEQAANLVNKAALGQAGALRRVGIDARNGASGVELLAQLERQFAGAAEDASRSAVGATDRLAVSVENAQEAFGTLLLPAVEEFANATAEAVDVVSQLVAVLGDLGRVKIPTIVIPFTTKEVGGGTVGGAAGKVAGLALLGGISPAALFAVGVKEAIDRIRGEQPPAKDINNLAREFDQQFNKFTDQTVAKVNQIVDKANTRLRGFGTKGFKPLEVNELGETMRRQFEETLGSLDLRFDQAEFAGKTQQALAVLAETEKVIRQRIATQGRTTDLLRQLFQVEQQRARILREGREAAQAAAEEARRLAAEQARAAREAQKALEQANQFRAIGLSPQGGDITPTVANLRKQFEQLSKNVVGQDVSSKLLARLKLVGNALSGGIRKITPETRAAIKELFDAIRSEFNEQTQKDIIPPRRVQISDKILRALGFNQDADVAAFRGVRDLAKNQPRFPTGLRPIGGGTATTGGITISGPITVVADDPDAFLRELQKKASRTTATARGRFPGKSLGLG